MSHKPIAISIKTFNRPESLRMCINSIYEHCDVSFRLYIADDSIANQNQHSGFYEKLLAEGHIIKTYPERVATTIARNDIVDSLQDEDYVLRLDDDFHFSKETKISTMHQILEDRPEIGAIADLECQAKKGKNLSPGEISPGQGYLVFDNGILHKIEVPAQNWLWMRSRGHRFAIANFTRNFLLIRRKVLANVKWNENLIIQGEHASFMMDLQNSGWLLAFTPDSLHYHNEPKKNRQSYAKARRSVKGNTRKDEEFERKYNITNVTTHNVLALRDARTGDRLSLLQRGIQILRKILSSPKK